MTVVKVETRNLNTFRALIKQMTKDGFTLESEPHSIKDKLFKATFTKIELDGTK